MCGIAGVIEQAPSGDSHEPAVREMIQALHHRGPDGSGVSSLKGRWCGAIGNARLAIIDVQHSHQPMIDPNGRGALVFNGEIYNFAELRPELEDRGVRFRTKGDTEVVLQALLAYGESALDRFNGMFGLCFVDYENDRVILARDRLGIKPLFYSWNRSRLVFGSELKAVFKSNLVEMKVNTGMVPVAFALGDPATAETIYADVLKLLPGHVLTLDRNGLRTRCYWSLQGIEPHDMDDRTAIDRLDELLSSAVELRMISEVPVGSFLSGGLDSSLITAYMAKIRPAPISFSVGYPAKSKFGNEFEYSRLAARHVGSDYREMELSLDDYYQAMVEASRYFDQPLHHVATPSLYMMAREARRHLVVTLQGQGADELFGGYRRYAIANSMAQLAGRLPLPATILDPIAQRLINSRWRPLNRVVGPMFLDHASLAAKASLTVSEHELSRLFRGVTGSRGVRLFGMDAVCKLFEESSQTDFLGRMLQMDLQSYLSIHLMTQDRITMSASIETRVPFLDHRVVEFAFGLPSRLKMRNGVRKWIVKEVARRYLPSKIIDRTKQGFSTPLHEWTQHGKFLKLLDDAIEANESDAVIHNRAYLREMATRARSNSLSQRQGKLFFKLLAFEMWRQQVLQRSASAA